MASTICPPRNATNYRLNPPGHRSATEIPTMTGGPPMNLSISYRRKPLGWRPGFDSVATDCHPARYAVFPGAAASGRLRAEDRQRRGLGRQSRPAHNARRPPEWCCWSQMEGRRSSLEQLIANSFGQGKRNVASRTRSGRNRTYPDPERATSAGQFREPCKPVPINCLSISIAFLCGSY